MKRTCHPDLIPTLLSLSSAHLPLSILSISLQQLSIYYSRFRTRLSATHGLHLKRLVTLLKEIQSYTTQWHADAKARGTSRPGHAEILTVGDLLSRLDKNVSGINLLEISEYLKRSKIARKINGYAEKTAEKARA
jgi:chromosome transmission fidelity protein 1